MRFGVYDFAYFSFWVRFYLSALSLVGAWIPSSLRGTALSWQETARRWMACRRLSRRLRLFPLRGVVWRCPL